MEGLNASLKKMHDATTRVEDCLSLLQTALTHNSLGPMKGCQERIAFAKETEGELTVRFAEMARLDLTLKPCISIPHLIWRAGDDTGRLAELINRKIKENMLFSDRAVSEINTLLNKLTEIVKTTADLFLVNNPVLIRFVQDAESEVVEKSLEFATLHEERLIEGLCLPLSSSLFLNMLDAIRSIAWDAKEISIRLANHRNCVNP